MIIGLMFGPFPYYVFSSERVSIVKWLDFTTAVSPAAIGLYFIVLGGGSSLGLRGIAVTVLGIVTSQVVLVSMFVALSNETSSSPSATG
ncbi:hypothetical protein D3C72_1794490 [compost metagenome]